MKKRRITVLGICAAVLVLLCVVLAVVKKQASDYEEKESEESSQTVFDITADQIDDITYTASGGSELHFKRNDDGKWTDESGTLLDQTKVGTLASSFTGVKLTKKMTDVSDLSEYGLDQPSYTCSFTDKDGKTTTFYLGNTNDSASVIYLSIDGDADTVYAVSTGITSEISSMTSMDDYQADSAAAEADSTAEASSGSESEDS